MTRNALILGLLLPVVANAADNRPAVLQSLARMLDTAYEIEHYALLHDHLPDAATPGDLAREIGHPEMSGYFVDAWGTDLRISIDPSANTYTIVSAGSDRAFAPATWSWPQESTDPTADAVIRDGQIVRSAMKWAKPPGSDDTVMANAMVWAKAKRTMADVRTLAAAVEAYNADHNAYPAATDLDALEKAISPAYIAKMPRTDGWGTPLKYSGDSAKYQIVSAGADKRFDSATWATKEQTPDLNKDLVYSGGQFVRAWQPDATSRFDDAWGSMVVALNRLADLRALSPEQRRTARVQGLLEESDRLFQPRSANQNAFVTSFRMVAEAASVDPDAGGRDRLVRYASEFRRKTGATAPPPQPGTRIPVDFYEKAEGKEVGRALIPLLQRYVSVHPSDEGALLALADVTDTVESPTRAAEVLENDLKQRPGNPSAWIRLAQLDLQMKNSEKAAIAVDTAIAMPKLTAEQMSDISDVYSQLGKRRRVLEIAREQVAAKPDNADALFFLGKTAYEAAAFDTVTDSEKRSILGEGETALRRALTLSPEYVESMAYLNLILRQRAAMETDPAVAKKLVKEADELRDQARFLLRRRSS